MSLILYKLTVNGFDFLFSDAGANLDQVYEEAVISPPSLSYEAKSNQGWIEQGTGKMTLANNPFKVPYVKYPFTFEAGTYPPAFKPYPFEMILAQSNVKLFSGYFVPVDFNATQVQGELYPTSIIEPDLLLQTLDDSRVRAEAFEGSAGQPLKVKATLHGLNDNQTILFEELSINTNLNYTQLNQKTFLITKIDANYLTLRSLSGVEVLSDSYQLGTAIAGYLGKPIVRKLAVGTVTHRALVKKATDTFSNPFFDTTKALTVYEDGVNLGNVITTFNADKIKLSVSPPGEVSFSGTGLLGSTLLDFAVYVAAMRNKALDATKATNAGTLKIAAFFDTQEKLRDVAGKIAAAYNHLFYEDATKLFLIERSLINGWLSEVETSEVETHSLISCEITYPVPTYRIESKWQVRIPFSGVEKSLGTDEPYSSLDDPVFAPQAIGKIESLDSYVEIKADLQTMLVSSLKTHNTPTAKITLQGVKIAAIGEQFKVNDNFNSRTVSFFVENISYELGQSPTTTFTGMATIEALQIG